MKKEDFLLQLRERMKGLSVTEEETIEHIERFEAYFAPMSEDECEQSIATMGGIEGVLASLEAFYGVGGSEPTEPTGEDGEENGPLDASERSDEEKAAEQTIVFEEKTVEAETAAPSSEKKRGAAFWTLFVLTLPLTFCLFAAMNLLFGLAFVLLSLLIACLTASAAVAAVGGTAVSLVGIVYGVFRLFTYLPTGLFELGLGILLFGVTLIASILLYNLAIRFLPFAIRKTAVLCGKLNRAVFAALKGGERA